MEEKEEMQTESSFGVSEKMVKIYLFLLLSALPFLSPVLGELRSSFGEPILALGVTVSDTGRTAKPRGPRVGVYPGL